MNIFLILVSLVFVCYSNDQAYSGVGVDVSANIEYNLDLGTGGPPTVTITVDEDATLTLSIIDTPGNITASLPSGITAYALEAGYPYYHIELTSGNIVSASIGMSGLSSAVIYAFSAVNVGVYWYNEDDEEWQVVALPYLESSASSLSVNIPFLGYYVLAIGQAGGYYYTGIVGSPLLFTTSTRKYNYENLIEIVGTATSAQNYITLTLRDFGGNTTLSGYTDWGIMFEITPEIEEDISATITLNYADVAELIDEDSFTWGYYDEDASAWVKVSTTVDTDEETIVTTTTHFSMWAPFTVSSTDGTDSSGGGNMPLFASFAVALFGTFLLK